MRRGRSAVGSCDSPSGSASEAGGRLAGGSPVGNPVSPPRSIRRCLASRGPGPALLALGVLGALGLVLAFNARADEGMWLFNDPPRERLREAYGFEISDEWLLHLQRSCVRMEASGALVSPDGLLMTNHHVGIDWISELEGGARDLLAEGYYAATRDAELPCHGVEVQILESIADVTDSIAGSGSRELPADEARALRQARIARLEARESARSGLDCEVVVLDRGARYHLYRYRTYDDVRLVFAPEERIANFGGDVDNFEYPRHALDLCFFRIYENGEPLRARDWLRWSRQGAAEGELVFAVGHPYETGRDLTLAELRLERDLRVPWQLRQACDREVALLAWSARSPANAGIALADLLGVQNWRKAQTGALLGLLDPRVPAAVSRRDADLRAWIEADPGRRQRWQGAWQQIESATEAERRLFRDEQLYTHLGRVMGSRLFRHALTLVELARELPRPNEERLPRYRDTELESVRHGLLRDDPIHDGYEIEGLTRGLAWFAGILGGEDSLVVALLDGQPPAARAAALVAGCTLRTPADRRERMEQGLAGLRGDDDPMIRLALLLAPRAGRAAREVEALVEGPREAGHTLLAEARLAQGGGKHPPDATGTLRLSYGVVRGVEEAGHRVPAFTDFGGLYARWESQQKRPPFDLPRLWVERRSRLAEDTPFNFVQTLDTVGGSSGSPIVNARGEVVGLLFDGNLATLVWDYAWVDDPARSVGVDSRGILEALRSIYQAYALVRELAPER